MADVSISIYHDTRRKSGKKLFPVKLRVYYRGETRLYPLGLRLSEEDFVNSYQTLKPKGDRYKELKIKLVSHETKANDIKASINVFSFERFEKKLLQPTGSRNQVFYHYEQTIKKLKQQGRIGTASNYAMSCRSLQQFLLTQNRKQKLAFEDITVYFLNQFEQWMLEKGNSISTVGIYLRPLRTLFNAAIEEGEVDKDFYPFSKRKYQIPAGRNTKKALSKEDLKTLFYFPTDDPFLKKARAHWFFSYSCSGMNTRDIAELRYKNIHNDILSFVRNKTRNTTRSQQKPILVVLTPYAQEVIQTYGNKKVNGDTYVFPILNDGMTAEERYRAAQAYTRFVNQHIKRLAKLAGITQEISTYWARHSFTTMAVRNGASLEFVQESLGHNSLQTTKSYFAGFADATKRTIANKLMDF
ncbi:MAG: integrase [Flavobacterium sp.]|nr:MAG: integrase [Flavobacterium sp.]